MSPDTSVNKPATDIQRPEQPGLYLGLFHGRHDRRTPMSDWGFAGPVLGPLRYCHTTYLQDIKIGFVNLSDARRMLGSLDTDVCLTVVDDMISLDGAYYGDWSVFYVQPDNCKLPDDTFRHKPRQNDMHCYRSRSDG
jgi:hypothetical protein